MNGQSRSPFGLAHALPLAGRARSSHPITLDQGAGYTSAVLYLWRPPESPVMIAMELSGDGDEEALLYLFSIEEAGRLQEAVQRLVEVSSEQGNRTASEC